MFCPKCSIQAVEGQRYCRNCGVNLGLIVDAMEGRAVSFDFETVKKDLRQLGQSLRTTFEEVRDETKRTRQLKQNQGQATASKQMFGVDVGDMFGKAADVGGALAGVGAAKMEELREKARERTKPLKIKTVRGGSTRQYSFQKGLLSLFGGAAMAGAWFFLLDEAWNAGLLQSLEQVLLRETHWEVVGLARVFKALWVLSLIPTARGVGHLLNGIFMPAKPVEAPADLVRQIHEQITQEQMRAQAMAPAPAAYVAPAPPAPPVAPAAVPQAPTTDDLVMRQTITERTAYSITEEPTEPLITR